MAMGEMRLYDDSCDSSCPWAVAGDVGGGRVVASSSDLSADARELVRLLARSCGRDTLIVASVAIRDDLAELLELAAREIT